MDANETTATTGDAQLADTQAGTGRKKETKPRISRRLGKEEYENCCRIYFIEAVGMHLVKIGYTIDPLKRFYGMLTMSPAPLSLLGTISGGPQKEVELHALLEPYKLHGEWFKMVPEVMAVVAGAEKMFGHEFHNQVAKERGAALKEYLAKMKAGEVVRPTRGPKKYPKGTQRPVRQAKRQARDFSGLAAALGDKGPTP